jgi:ferritin-like metal-binding protein YciE
MIDKANSSQLKAGLSEHLQQTKGQLSRLDRNLRPDFRYRSRRPEVQGHGRHHQEGEEIAKAKGDPEARDACIISAAQRVKHYEIDSNGSARTYAQLLGHGQWAQLLQQTLDEEKQTNQKLKQLAERVNVEAKAGLA